MKINLTYRPSKYFLLLFQVLCLFLLVTGTGFRANAQTITNPSFETYSSCPNGPGDLAKATGWIKPSDPLWNYISPDYFNSCNYLPFGVFDASHVLASNGNGFAGMAAEGNTHGIVDWKEYISTSLGSAMVAGRTYTITFDLRAASGNPLTADPSSIMNLLPASERGYFGLCFSSVLPTVANTTTPVPTSPTYLSGSIVNSFASTGRVYVPAASPAYNGAWQTVTLSYTATGGEQFMTVGQFRPGSTSISAADGRNHFAYFFVDNFIFTAPPCNAGTAQVSLSGSSLANVCPATTVNLNSLFTGTAPTGSSLVWYTTPDHSGSAYSTPGTAGAGTYYAFFYDATNNCYNTASSTASVAVTINAPCCNAGTAQVGLTGAALSSVCPAITANLNSLFSGTAPTGTSLVWFTTANHAGTAYGTPTAAIAGTYYAFFYDAVNNCYNTGASTASVVVTTPSCGTPPAGMIDCSKTMLIPSPVAGTPGEVDLVVTVNVTVAGCFSPLTISGSGFSISPGFTQKCVSATGVQQLNIPVKYDGSALGTLTFTIGQAGTCTADLTKPPVTKVISIWTLDNCTLLNVTPKLK